MDISVWVCVFMCVFKRWGRDTSHVVTLLFTVCLHVCAKHISLLWRKTLCLCMCVFVLWACTLSTSPCVGDLHSFCRTGRAVVRLDGAFGTALADNWRQYWSCTIEFKETICPYCTISTCVFHICTIWSGISSQLTLWLECVAPYEQRCCCFCCAFAPTESTRQFAANELIFFFLID